MERLLVLRLRSRGCAAEAWVNDIPLGRTPPGGGRVDLPIHEYVASGANRVQLVVEPLPVGAAPAAAAEARFADGVQGAALSLLLPRVGQPASEERSRTLAQLEWQPADGEVYEPPVELSQTVQIPVQFPRWRWLDAPPVADAAAHAAPLAKLVQAIAVGLARGDGDPLVACARLRFEELALAYQRPVAGEIARWRDAVRAWHAVHPLRPALPTAASLRLRRCAGGGLLECLAADGRPALRAPGADGTQLEWPLRVAVVDGQYYVLR